MKNVDASQLHVPLLDIHPEGKLQKEINDIIDELDMMIHVNKKQNEVIRRFQKQVEPIMDRSGKFRKIYRGGEDTNRSTNQTPTAAWPGTSSSEDSEEKRKENQFFWFTTNASELISEVEDRLDELYGLRQSAERTAQSVSTSLNDGVQV